MNIFSRYRTESLAKMTLLAGALLLPACESQEVPRGAPRVELAHQMLNPPPEPERSQDTITVSHVRKGTLPRLVPAWRRDGTEDDSILMVPRIHAVSERFAIIIDAARQSVVLVNLKDGSVEREFGRRGHGPGELADAASIAVLSERRMAIFDRENSSVKTFDFNGELISEEVAEITSMGSACALSDSVMLVSLLGKDDIAQYVGGHSLNIAVHRLWPDQEDTEALLRTPLMVTNRSRHSCFAVQPYGGRIAELSATGVVRRDSLYTDNRPVKITKRGKIQQGTVVRVIRGSPTIEDACLSENQLLFLRATSDHDKVLDVFDTNAFEYLGSLPIDHRTITISCNAHYVVAKEYSDGLLSFVAYTKVIQ